LALDRSIAELRRIQRERVKGKFFKVCYYLKKAIPVTEISRRADLEIEKVGSFGATTYAVRLPDFYKIACVIGDIATITFKTSTIGIPDKILLGWAKHFGKVIGKMRYNQMIYF